MKELLKQIREKAIAEIEASDRLDEIRIQYLGKKGELTAVLRGMGKVSPEERPLIGQLANEVRAEIEAALAKKEEEKAKKELENRLLSEKIDVTVPGTPFTAGHRHPLAQTEEMLRDIFIGMGFSIAEGPEVEYDYYNFEALNLPKNHPARDTQDTFYIRIISCSVPRHPPFRRVSWNRLSPRSATSPPVEYIVLTLPTQHTLLSSTR